jgi:hypothetical protein
MHGRFQGVGTVGLDEGSESGSRGQGRRLEPPAPEPASASG